MPDFMLPPNEIREITDYLLLSLRERPPALAPLPPADSDQSYENGRDIFQVSRCISCHALEGKGGTMGPDLFRVESKIHRDWLWSWLSFQRSPMCSN